MNVRTAIIGQQVVIKKLGTGMPNARKIATVELLGSASKLKWKQNADGLFITFPKEKYGDYARALKIRFNKSKLTGLKSGPIKGRGN